MNLTRGSQYMRPATEGATPDYIDRDSEAWEGDRETVLYLRSRERPGAGSAPDADFWPLPLTTRMVVVWLLRAGFRAEIE